MSTVSRVEDSLQEALLDAHVRELFGTRAEQLARQTGFVQRRSPITGSVFARSLVFGFLDQPEASYPHLQQMTAFQGVDVSVQAIEQRMSEQASRFLLSVLQEMMGLCLASEPVVCEVLEHFNGVYLQDGTVISLPKELESQYRGSGGSTETSGRSALRIQVRLNLSNGQMQGPWLQDARDDERSGPACVGQTPLPAGALFVVDSGQLNYELMRGLDEQSQFWLTYAKSDLKLIDERGVRCSLPQLLGQQTSDVVDQQVRLGKAEVPARLIAFRVSKDIAQNRRERANESSPTRHKGARDDVQVGRKRRAPRSDGRKRNQLSKKRQELLEWTIILTNVPAEQLTARQARVLMRARWQIELFWKLWKQDGKIDCWRSEKPMRILCEIYAKMIGLILQHWLTILGCWQDPHRSLVKAAQVVRLLAPCYVLGLADWFPLSRLLQLTQFMMHRCRLYQRRGRPSTSQLLLACSADNSS